LINLSLQGLDALSSPPVPRNVRGSNPKPTTEQDSLLLSCFVILPTLSVPPAPLVGKYYLAYHLHQCITLSREASMHKELKIRKVVFSELTNMLGEYERKYGYSTIEFFRRYSAGELGDNDDLMMWAGIYHLYLTSHPVRQFMCDEVALAA
jgi:hypothetical protein